MSVNLTDKSPRLSDAELDKLAGQQTGEFVKGMRSGGNAAMGSLNNLAGAVGQKLGANDFAAGRFGAADQYEADAAAAAPRVASWRDVHSPGDLVDYGAGLAGGMVPVGAAALGATALTGGGFIPAMAAGTAVMAPVEAGDIVGRMRQQGLPIDLGRAAAGGVGSAALQNVLPGVARAKLGGSLARIPGGALAAIPEQAGLAAGSEAGKQLATNPQAPLDTHQIIDAGVGGAAMGVPIAGMHAVGGARSTIGAAADAVGGAARDATKFVGDKAKGVAKATTDAAGPAGKTVEGLDIPGALASVRDESKTKAKNVLDSIANSDDIVGDARKFFGAQGDKLKAMVVENDNGRIEQVKAYAQELANKALTPKQQATVSAWAADTGNHAKQAAVAGIKVAKDAYDTAKGHVDRFSEAVSTKVEADKARAGETPKKSEDESGIRAAILEHVLPVLQKARPELLDPSNPGMAQDHAKVASSLRRLVEELSAGKPPSSNTIARLIDLAPGHVDTLVEAAHKAVGTAQNPQQTAAFFKGLNQITAVKDSNDTLVQTLRKHMNEAASKDTSDQQLRDEAAELMKWRDDKRPITGPNADPAAQRLNYLVQKHLDTHYGTNGEAVLTALEKARQSEDNALERARVKYDEDGQPIDSGVEYDFSEIGSPNGRMQFFGAGPKGKDLYVHPEDDPGKNGRPGAAMQRLEKVKAMYPESTPRFITASEMGPDHPWLKSRYEQLVKIGNDAGVDGDRYAMKQMDRFGVVATERATHGTDLTFDELDAMKFDRKKFDAKSSPAALHTGVMAGGTEIVLDAVKITKSMAKRFKDDYAPGDDIGEQARTARIGRMFIEGVAAAQAHLGKAFDIPNDTFLGKFDDRSVTWADVKKLDRRSEADKENDGTTRYLTDLRKALMATEDKALRKEMIRDGLSANAKRQNQKDWELSREDSRKVDDEPGTGYTSDDGIPMERRTHSRKTKDDFKTGEIGEGVPGDTGGTSTQSARVQRMNEVRGELSPLFERIVDGTATPADRVKDRALRNELDTLSKMKEGAASGRTEIDPFGPTHDALRGEIHDSGAIHTDGGEARSPFLPQRINEPGAALPANHPGALKPRATEPPNPVIGPDREYGNKSWPALRRAAAEAARAFKDPNIDTDTVGFTHDGKDYSVRQLALDAWEVLNAKNEVVHSIGKADPKGAPPDPKELAARKAAFLERARSGDESLTKEIGQHTDAVGLQNAAVHLMRHAASDPSVAKTIDALNTRIGELVRSNPQQAYDLLTRQEGKKFSLDVKANPHDAVEQYLMELVDSSSEHAAHDVAEAKAILRDEYGHKSFSAQPVAPNSQGPVNRQEVRDYINRTLGSSVKLAWDNLIRHAGEFERMHGSGNVPTEDVIRLSVHAMNPLSTAYHESLHAFMQKLTDMKHGPIMDVLNRAGESAPVLNQLKKWMAERGMGEAALKQLNNPEERAAYMYQAWADGKLTVGDQTKTVFGKIADFVRSVLGIWSNDQRALHIMEYFHSGEFAKNMGDRDAVGRDLMGPGRNRAIEAAKKMTEPFRNMGENLAVAGGQRLRDTGIPALRELADAMKLHGAAEGADAGFVPAARSERTRVMNKMAADMKDFAPTSINAALESLQSLNNKAIDKLATPEERVNARQAKVAVRKVLDGMYQYMTDAGVKVNDLGVGRDYFPRVWDTSYISSHQPEFLAMVNKYVASGQYKGDPKRLMHKLMVSEGAEFTSEVDKPGMQHLKPRELAFMAGVDTAPFMRKDLHSILNGYITQATRRAEWAKRFGDSGKGVDQLLAKAKAQGATPDDLEAGQKFVRSVDGTLGDTINPEARRLFGNMIVYQNLRLLPLMIFSSAVDPMGIAVRGGTVGDAFSAFKRGIAEIPKSFKKNPGSDAATDFAASVGVIDDATLVHTLGALYSQGMVGDTGRKINDTLFRYNMAEQYNTSMRVSATEAAMGFLARHADGKADVHSQRWLNELGLQPGEVKLDATGRPKVFEHEGITLEQSAKMKSAINRWVDGAVLRPDAVDKPIWMSDPHFALFAHLKQFTFSFHETILKRVAHEYSNGNYAPAMALASYVPMMIAADMMKGLIQGGGQQPSWKENWGVGDYIMSGIERAGLLGVGQFGADMLGDIKRGGSGIGALSGPTVEQLTDAVRTMGGREAFGHFALKSMPANALYATYLGGNAPDPKFVD